MIEVGINRSILWFDDDTKLNRVRTSQQAIETLPEDVTKIKGWATIWQTITGFCQAYSKMMPGQASLSCGRMPYDVLPFTPPVHAPGGVQRYD